jgi:hypothetical protein
MNESPAAPVVTVPGRALRRHADRRGRCHAEKAMQLPNVIEVRRGSAHGAPVVSPTAAASNPHQTGGPRWNSGN